MKFAHFSDCHLGGWKEPKLRELGVQSFRKAIHECMQEYVGFILIAGDLFDVALPAVDVVKDVTSILKEVKDHDIPVYVIPGSHDYSPSGKTIIDILEKAGLVENVAREQFTVDRTGMKLIGMHGRKGALEREEYARLERSKLEAEEGFKIFLFHSLLEETKPPMFQQMEGLGIAQLPKGFQYYAGGHPHFQYAAYHPGHGTVAYPGPTFPNNFKELEELQCGGYVLVEVSDELRVQHRKIPLVPVVSYLISAEGETPDVVEREIKKRVQDVEGKIVLVRVEGCLQSGKASDIDWKGLQEQCASAYAFLKISTKVTSQEYKEIQVDESKTIDEVEQELIRVQGGNVGKEKVVQLLQALHSEKLEGERNSDFEVRVIRDASKVVNLE